MKYAKESGMAGLAVVVAVSALPFTHSRSASDTPTAVVVRRTFADVIVETGVIGTERMRLYSSQITGTPAKLLSLVPEGRTVAAGDALAQFDVSGLMLIRDRARAELEQAEAEMRRAEADAEIDALRAATDLDAAVRQADTADRALTNQQQGKGVVERTTADAAVNDAARELALARTTAADMAGLLKEGFVTRAEVDRAEQALRRAEEQHRLAVTRRESLVTYEAPATLSRAEADAKGAMANVARQQATSAARQRERAAEIAVARSRRDQLRLNIAALSAQIDHGTLRADAPGMVIHQLLYFGADQRKPQVGDEIVAGQPLVAIPDAGGFIVETAVREVDLHRVQRATRVTVSVDAYPGASFPATVSLIGALAHADAARAGAKFFPVTAALSTTDPRLRSGMTARVEIEVASVPDALVVPAIAVFEDDGGRHVLVATPAGVTERRDVTVAAENGSFAALSRGVREGEHVRLVDPAQARRR